MKEQRGYWYIITGLLIGLALGIAYAWGLAPIEYVDTSPASLRADFKNDYRFIIAASYAANHDLDRARARLALLGDSDIIQAMGAQAQQMLGSNAPMENVRILANLSEDLQAAPTPTEIRTQEPTALPSSSPLNKTATTLPPSPTNTPRPLPSATQIITIEQTSTRTPTQPTPISTATPRPTRTASPTPGQPFQLVAQSTFCQVEQPGLLQIYIKNAARNPAPGIEITLAWQGSSENFFTGLKPEIDPGYADFVMSAGTTYSLSLSNGSTRITDLSAPACPSADGNTFPGGIRLDFEQP